MLRSDWLIQNLLRSDWLGPSGASFTTIAYWFVAVCLLVMLIRDIDSLLILQLLRWIIVTT